MSNFCPHLWNGFTISNNGDIYSCCLSKAIKIGNIYEEELKKLINISALLEYRKRSLEGDLICYNSCTFVKKDISIEKIPNYTKIRYSQLKKIDLIFGRACNISCIMCRYVMRPIKDEPILNSKILQNNIDITPFKEIIIQGGEPLFIPECLNYMTFLENIGKKYTILTNGVLINDEMAQRLSLYAKRVIISINAANKKVHERVNQGSNFNKLIRNIKRLQSYRNQNGTELKIIGRMTITLESILEIPDFIQKFSDFGVDYINFGYDKSTVPQLLLENPSLKEKLKIKIINSLKSADLERIDTLRLIYLGFVEYDMFNSNFFRNFHEMI